jgi:signal transduction histidine kinase/CheY-like chemotaxis protein
MKSAQTSDDEPAGMGVRPDGGQNAGGLPGIDAVVRLASVVCEVPIAVLTMVDGERVRLLASVGLPGVHEFCGEGSFCAQTVLGRELLEVTDATTDPRFAKSALVVDDPRIVFYAGVPLAGADGCARGTVCVMDRSPRRLSPSQAMAMRELASIALHLLDSRRADVAGLAAAQETRAAQAIAELAAERNFQRTVLANIPNGAVFLFDGDLIVRRVFGRETLEAAKMTAADYENRTVDEWALPENRDRIVEACRRCLAGERARIEVARSGRHFEVTFVPLPDPTGAVVRGLALSYDVTERDALREQLARHERLVTTGTLAAGIGHEINNPLTFVTANIDLALAEIRMLGGASPSLSAGELGELLSDAREGAERIRKIVRGLRSLAREEEGLVAVDVHAVLDLSINMAMHELRHRASLSKHLDPVPLVFADEARLAQVFVNLLVNAAQAFRDANIERNTVLVRTSTDDLGRAVIEVIDNGLGIPPDALPRIFDPFFTTKPVGQGTGLGLSICHNIVTALGGSITCTTAADQGTTFRVVLNPAQDSETLTAAPSIHVPPGPRGRVLIVDDEEIMTRSLRRVLGPEHDVVACNDSRDALRLIEANEVFDVVFCDLVMPHLTGIDLHEKVRRLRPEMAERFVFMTGGIADADVRDFLSRVPNERIEKPFSSENARGIARRYVGVIRSQAPSA